MLSLSPHEHVRGSLYLVKYSPKVSFQLLWIEETHPLYVEITSSPVANVSTETKHISAANAGDSQGRV